MGVKSVGGYRQCSGSLISPLFPKSRKKSKSKPSETVKSKRKKRI